LRHRLHKPAPLPDAIELLFNFGTQVTYSVGGLFAIKWDPFMIEMRLPGKYFSCFAGL